MRELMDGCKAGMQGYREHELRSGLRRDDGATVTTLMSRTQKRKSLGGIKELQHTQPCHRHQDLV